MRGIASTLLICVPTLAGCATALCGRPTIEDGDAPVGEPATHIRVLAAQPDQHWVIYSRLMRDTNGDGVIWPREDYYWRPLDGDDPDVFLALGGAAPQHVEAFLGATENELGIVRDGMLELVHARTGARRLLGDAPPLTFPTMTRDPQLPRDAHMLRNGLLVWPTRDRRGAELLNTEDETRRVIPSHGWVHSVWVDATESWAVIESIDAAPEDPSDWEQRPQIPLQPGISHPGYGPCWGVSWCTGPTRTFQFVNLGDPSASPLTRTFDTRWRGALRPWGLVVHGAEMTTLESLDGTSHSSVRPGCEVVYAGMGSPIVVAHCRDFSVVEAVSFGPLFVVRLGSSEEEPFNEQTIGTLADADRTVLSRPDLQLALNEGRSYWPLRWNPEVGRWEERSRRNRDGVVAVSSDGSALLSRWSTSGRSCEAEFHQTQLVWVQLNERWRRELSIFDYRNHDDLSQ